MKKRLLALVCACALSVLCMPASAWAGVLTSSGNVFSSGDTPVATVERDLYWAGESLQLQSAVVGNDVIAAGRAIELSGGSVGGSVRAAGQIISLANVSIDENVTLAGQMISIAKETNAVGMYVCGQDVSFAGTADDVFISAETVTIDGVVHGDVRVSARQITIGANANITGTLYVEAPSEPTVPSGAQIGALDFTPEVSTTVDDSQDASWESFGIMGMMGSFAYQILSIALAAILLTWILRDAVAGSVSMIRQRTAPLIVTGLVGAFVAPIAFIMLLIFVVTAPLAFAFSSALFALTFVGVAFMSASLAQLIFPRMNRFGAAALGGAVGGLLSAMPFLGMFVSFCGFAYVLGYTLQCMYLHLKKSPVETISE